MHVLLGLVATSAALSVGLLLVCTTLVLDGWTARRPITELCQRSHLQSLLSNSNWIAVLSFPQTRSLVWIWQDVFSIPSTSQVALAVHLIFLSTQMAVFWPLANQQLHYLQEEQEGQIWETEMNVFIHSVGSHFVSISCVLCVYVCVSSYKWSTVFNHGKR